MLPRTVGDLGSPPVRCPCGTQVRTWKGHRAVVVGAKGVEPPQPEGNRFTVGPGSPSPARSQTFLMFPSGSGPMPQMLRCDAAVTSIRLPHAGRNPGRYVPPPGVEPGTSRVSAGRSSALSYEGSAAGVARGRSPVVRGPPGTRTPNPPIKSRLLCHIELAVQTVPICCCTTAVVQCAAGISKSGPSV